MTYLVTINGCEYRVELISADDAAGNNGAVPATGGSRFRCMVANRTLEVDVAATSRDTLSLLVEGRACEIRSDVVGGESYIVLNGTRYDCAVRDPRQRQDRRDLASIEGPVKLSAPMPGKIVTVLVSENQSVDAGQGIMVIEAMKMQNELKSPKPGRVRKLFAAEGTSVNTGDVLAIVE